MRFKDKEIDITMTVGVTDEPFKTDNIDEEGIDVIIGVDFLQKARIKLDFS